MDRRISPPREFEELLNRLTEPPLEIFQTKQKVLMFAAALGKYLNRKTPVERKGTAIRMDIFEKALDDGFLNALAVADTGDLNVLRTERDDERANIFESYAHSGLHEINRRCFEMAGDPLQNLIQLLEEVRSPSDVEIPGIDPIVLRDLL